MTLIMFLYSQNTMRAWESSPNVMTVATTDRINIAQPPHAARPQGGSAPLTLSPAAGGPRTNIQPVLPMHACSDVCARWTELQPGYGSTPNDGMGCWLDPSWS